MLSFVLVFTAACDKEDKAAPSSVEEDEKSCNLVRQEWTNTSGYSLTTVVEYDGSGRLSSAVTTSQNGATHQIYVRDSAGRIIRVEYKRGTEMDLVAATDITYDSQGRRIRATEMYGNMTELEYDIQDRVTKSTYTSHTAGNTYEKVSTYEYTDGNLTTISTSQDGGPMEVREYAYAAKKAPREGEFNQLRRFLGDEGSPSQNLLTKSTTTFTGSGATVVSDFVYEFNEEGYPTLVTVDSKASEGISPRESTSVTKSTYNCE